MEDVPTTSVDEDFVDIAKVRILDLRTLGQDEIQCLAQLCGDVPARLQDLVNVIVNKSIFNESAGSKRQTYDRDRVPRKRDRRLSAGSASAQLQLALEGAGHSHRDLILHICRQSHISEKGDKALYQAHAVQPAGVVVEGNRSMSLKRMARATFTGRADTSTQPISSDGAVNGKAVAMEVLHRSSKKMKTKEEARRRAAESQAGPISIDDSEIPEELVSAKIISAGHEERESLESTPKHEGAVVAGGMNSLAQTSSDLMSPESQMRLSGSAFMNEVDPLDLASGSFLVKPLKGVKPYCDTCSVTFANAYSLRRHAASTGHAVDENLFGKVTPKEKKALPKDSLRCSCGNTYATPFTLRRHAIRNGHTAIIQDVPAVAETLQPENAGDVGTPAPLQAPRPPGKGNIQAHLSKRPWKRDVRKFKCRTCHRQFLRRKHYIRHLDTHYQKAKKKKKKKKKKGKPSGVASRPIGDGLSRGGEGSRPIEDGSSRGGGVKVKRLGRPPKHEPKLEKAVPVVADNKEEGPRQKRKFGLEALLNSSRRTKSRKGEETTSQRAAAGVPPLKRAIITCEECGKIFEEFSRHSGHQSMHSRLRKVYIGDMSISTKWVSWLELKQASESGYRRLLTDTTGTCLSGLPAKLLFPAPSELTADTGER